MNRPTLAEFERGIGLHGTFYDFVQLAWPHIDPKPFVPNWHLALICSVLERVFRRAAGYRKVAINIPPGLSKSTLVCVLWPVWCWIRDPTQSFLGTSFDAELTRRDAGKSLALIQCDWFRARWGDRVAVEEGAGAGSYENRGGGWRFSTSTGGRATGRHPDIRIIDDPTKPQTVSQGTLEDAEKYWRETLSTRQKDAATVCTVLIMQRLHTGDLAGIFEREGGWHFVVLPMRYELAGDREPYPGDPRAKPGELLCPARYDEAAVRELERNLGSRGAAAQLQQRPFPEHGTIIQREWIQWYEPGKLPALAQKIQTWDLTFKDTEGSHYVAGQVWGVEGPNFYFVDGILEKLDFVASIKAILDMRASHRDAIGVLIEDKANGPAVMSMLEDKVPGIVAVEPLGGKAARLNAVAPLFEARNVWLPKGHPIAEQLARSLVAFPSGTIDDDVDACTQVLNHLHGGWLDYGSANFDGL